MRRPGAILAALLAAVTELLIVAGTGNQQVTEHWAERGFGSDSALRQQVKLSVVAFPWRFTPRYDDSKLWGAQLIAIAALVVLIFFFVWILVHGLRAPGGFWPTFVGTWAIVVLAGLAASAVRGLWDYRVSAGGSLGRVGTGLFNGPSAPGFVFLVGTGLIPALVAAIVASVRGRTTAEEDLAEPSDPFFAGSPPPFSQPSYAPAPPVARPWPAEAGSPPPWSAAADQGADVQHTVAFDRPPAGEPPRADTEPTQTFGVPADDATAERLVVPPGEPGEQPAERTAEQPAVRDEQPAVRTAEQPAVRDEQPVVRDEQPVVRDEQPAGQPTVRDERDPEPAADPAPSPVIEGDDAPDLADLEPPAGSWTQPHLTTPEQTPERTREHPDEH